MKQISNATEDYLKAIYAHTEWQDEPITPSVLATRLGVAPPSVTEMVKKLAALGLIEHVPYGPLTLTETGQRLAASVVRRHRLIETWLVRDLGYSWDEVHEEAEVLEHALSDRLLEALDRRLGSPPADPHGDLIPAADGTVPRVPSILLAAAPTGHRGTVLRISDRDPDVLRSLAAVGVGPGVDLTVGEDGQVTLASGDVPTLSPAATAAIWLSA